FDVADPPALVRLDPAQIEQAILNLVLNARDALPGPGHIRIEVARVEPPAAHMAAEQTAQAAEFVRLRISDDGVGMSAEARAHLFEPFFTTKALGKGSGLGLASVYGIVSQNNGFIGVDSEAGRGTAITMHFPACAAPEPARAA